MDAAPGDHGIPLYGLIDEYDNFANTVLAHRGRAPPVIDGRGERTVIVSVRYTRRRMKRPAG